MSRNDKITHDGMCVTIERVTPKKCEMWLKNVFRGQRKVRIKNVEKYARDMEDGRWMFSDAAFCFDDDGALIQGRHRALACIQSGVSFDTLVVRGMSTATYTVMDQGLKRSPIDVLTNLKVAQPASRAAVARRLVVYDSTGKFGPAITPSSGEVVECAVNEQLIEDAVKIAGRVRHATGAQISVVGTLYVIMAREAPNHADWFFERLVDGVGVGTNDPVWLLRERLMRESMAKSKLRQAELLALFIKAWNATVRGEEMNNLRWRSVGPTAEPFPDIEFPSKEEDDELAA